MAGNEPTVREPRRGLKAPVDRQVNFALARAPGVFDLEAVLRFVEPIQRKASIRAETNWTSLPAANQANGGVWTKVSQVNPAIDSRCQRRTGFECPQGLQILDCLISPNQGGTGTGAGPIAVSFAKRIHQAVEARYKTIPAARFVCIDLSDLRSGQDFAHRKPDPLQAPKSSFDLVSVRTRADESLIAGRKSATPPLQEAPSQFRKCLRSSLCRLPNVLHIGVKKHMQAETGVPATRPQPSAKIVHFAFTWDWTPPL